MVVNLLGPFTTAFEHSSALQTPDVFLTFSGGSCGVTAKPVHFYAGQDKA
jgi:hypothetical protein